MENLYIVLLYVAVTLTVAIIAMIFNILEEDEKEMKLIDKRRALSLVKFRELNTGDIFENDGNIYMKIEEQTDKDTVGHKYALNLRTYVSHRFSYETLVGLLDTELIIKGYKGVDDD